MLAKLENLGSFAAILRDKGLNLTYSVIPDTIKIMVEFQKGGKSIKKDIVQYLTE